MEWLDKSKEQHFEFNCLNPVKVLQIHRLELPGFIVHRLKFLPWIFKDQYCLRIYSFIRIPKSTFRMHQKRLKRKFDGNRFPSENRLEWNIFNFVCYDNNGRLFFPFVRQNACFRCSKMWLIHEYNMLRVKLVPGSKFLRWSERILNPFTKWFACRILLGMDWLEWFICLPNKASYYNENRTVDACIQQI